MVEARAEAKVGFEGDDRELLFLVSSLVCTLVDDHIVSMNPAGLKMLSAPSMDTVYGIPFANLITEDYRFLIEGGWDLLAEEDFVPLKLTRFSGQVFDAEMRVRPLDPVPRRIFLEIRDISKYVRSAQALREREERLQGILHSVSEGIVTVKETGTIESANSAAERMFRYPPGGLIGRHIEVLARPAPSGHAADDKSQSSKFCLTPGEVSEFNGVRQDGTTFAMEIGCSELRHGPQKLYTAILRDISERKESEERIRRLAHHDNLTGLPNRNLLQDRMTQALARVRRNGSRLAVLYVDLDKFKPINDNLGHKAGDIVLMEVARRLMDAVRNSDTVARLGGDEFVIVIEDVARASEAAKIASKIVTRLSHPMEVLGRECQIGASIGVAIFPDDGADLDEVFKAADIAMYRVKNSGRNGYQLYGEGAAADGSGDGE